MFLMSYKHGSARVSLRNLDVIPGSLSSPPSIVSKLLDPSEQPECASSRCVRRSSSVPFALVRCSNVLMLLTRV